MGNKKKYYTKYWLPLIIYCALIFGQDALDFPAKLLHNVDKCLHFFVYALLGFLIFRAFTTISKKINIIVTIIISVFAATMIGLTDEIFQLFIPSRTLDRIDLLFDFLGSIFGIIIFLLIQKSKKKAVKTKPEPMPVFDKKNKVHDGEINENCNKTRF